MLDEYLVLVRQSHHFYPPLYNMPLLYYRIVRYINRYIVWTPEYLQPTHPDRFIQAALQYRGYPYILGGDGSSITHGIDCSHLIARVLIDIGTMHPSFYRTARYLVSLTDPIGIDTLV
jgi:hypothetical protein